eukprot:SAG31_NODE_1170_length_9560_cov_3.537031_5_plen_88_part_00
MLGLLEGHLLEHLSVAPTMGGFPTKFRSNYNFVAAVDISCCRIRDPDINFFNIRWMGSPCAGHQLQSPAVHARGSRRPRREGGWTES